MAANDETSRRRILPTFRSPILFTLHEWQFKKEISPFLWWITRLLETVSSNLSPFYLHQILLLCSWEENGIFHIFLYSRRLSNFSFLHNFIISNFFPTIPQSVLWDETSMNKSVNLSLIFKINPGVFKETS